MMLLIIFYKSIKNLNINESNNLFKTINYKKNLISPIILFFYIFALTNYNFTYEIYILTFESIILIPSLLIITREFVISGTREYMLKKNGKAIDVTFLSKIKTMLQFISISLFLAQDFLIKYLNIFNFAYIILWIATILTIYTGLKYSYMTYIVNQKRK